MVSVHLLYARGSTYFPLDLVPYTPAAHFKKAERDPEFKSKPQLALELIDQYQEYWSFRAVLADSFYGRNLTLTHRLIDRKIPFVLALSASYSWWHFPEEIGGVEEQAHRTPAESWLPLIKTFADGHREHLWVAETQDPAFGPEKSLRLVVVTTDPVELPAATTEYLILNLRVSEQDLHQNHVQSAPATCQEVALLYGRRVIIEQAYREVKQHLGWAEYQVRSSVAIQRHWALVCAAFCFLCLEKQVSDGPGTEDIKKPESWCRLLRSVRGWLEPFVWLKRYWKAFSDGALPQALQDVLEQCRRGHSLCLFVT